MARLQQYLPQRCRVRFYFSLPQSRMVSPASAVAATMPRPIPIFFVAKYCSSACGRRCRHAAASDYNLRCVKEECPACSKTCRYDAVSDSNFLSPQRRMVPPAVVVAALRNCPPAALSLSQGRTARLLFYRGRRDEWPACRGRRSIDEFPACRMTVAGAGEDRMPRRRHNPK